MDTPLYHLAQVNIARMRFPITDPQMAGFVTRLDEINALAEAAPGFVWRLTTPEGNATSIRPYDDDFILVNMSVWESIETLMAYAYRTDHSQLIKGRQQWFEKMDLPTLAMWWLPAGEIPSVEWARGRRAFTRSQIQGR